MATTATKPEQPARERIIEIVSKLPIDSSYEEILKELAFNRMIDDGLADSDAGRTVSHEEAGQVIASWAK